MELCKFCTAGNTRALEYAAAALWASGWEYDASARTVLLPVPSFDPDGRIKGGGRIEDILSEDPLIIGGNLNHRALEGVRCLDLLKDPQYLAENAAITAHCAIHYATENLPVTLYGCPVLVLGWGRIGKCLADLLKRIGADITVYARKETDRATLCALGYRVLDTLHSPEVLSQYRVIFNTVPAMLLPKGTLSTKQIKIDLASVPGIEGTDVIWARGLPNKDAPESSGTLIARTVDRLGKEFLL